MNNNKHASGSQSHTYEDDCLWDAASCCLVESGQRSEVLTAAIIDTILPPFLEYLHSSANFHLVRMDESKLYEHLLPCEMPFLHKF